MTNDEIEALKVRLSSWQREMERSCDQISFGSFATLPEKPPYGSPCNGCGQCCIAQQCPISTALFGEQEICPALEYYGQALGCGLIRNTADYVPDLPAWGGELLTEAFGLMIGAGIGCDGTLAGEEPEREGEKREQMRTIALTKIAAASPEAQMLVSYFREKP